MSNLATITNNILADSGIDDINVVVTNGSYANPAWITSLAWTKITGAPTIVTNVTATSPIFSSGGTTPNITIQQAGASASGFLSNTDWNTFNNKQNTISLTTTGTSGVATLIGTTLNIPNYGGALSGYLPLTGGTLTGPLGGTSASFSGDVTANRYRGVNSLVLNSYTTVNPSSNVYLYSPGNDRDAWIYLDSADTSSNWGIYHRQIDSAVAGLPGNSIGFIGGGSSVLQGWISLLTGQATFNGNITATSTGVDGTFADAFILRYSANNNETNSIQTAVSSAASQSGFRFQVSNGAGSSARTTVVDFLRDRQIFYGNVLIGTISDNGAKLQVSGGDLTVRKNSSLTNPEADLGFYNSFINTNSTNGTGSAISLGSNNNPGVSIYAQLVNNSTNEHVLGFQVRNNINSSTTRMLLNGAGNLLIGTTTDSGQRRLQVNGTARILDGGAVELMQPGNGNYSFIRSVTNGDFRVSTGGTADALIIANAGAATFSSSVRSNDVNAFLLSQTGNTTDTKTWSIQNLPTSGQFRIRALNDSETNGINAIVISRTGISSLSLDFTGAATFSSSVTATSFSATDSTGSAILTTNGGGEGVLSVNTANPLRFFTNSTDRMRITSDGTIGFNGNSGVGNAGLDKMSMGYLNSNYGWIQTWSGTPLLLNPSGNPVIIGSTSNNGERFQVTGNATFTGGINPTKTAKNTYAIQIRGALYGAPRLQLYDLAVDPNAFVGLGVDMSGAPYEFSNYFPRTGGNGRWSVGSWAGDFGAGQYVSGYNEKFFIVESAAQFNIALTVSSTVTANGVRSINGGVDGTFADAFIGVYSANNNETNAIQTAVSSAASQSGFRFQASNGAGSSGRTTIVDFLRDRQIFYGNVGIGVAPATNLHVQGASVSYGQFRLLNSSSSGEASMHIGRTNQTLEQRWTIGQGVAGIGDSFGFYTGGSSRVNITTGGNFLIGITTDNGYRLRVRGGDTNLIEATTSGTNARINLGHSVNGGFIGYANIGAGAASNTFYVSTGAGAIGTGITMNNNAEVTVSSSVTATSFFESSDSKIKTLLEDKLDYQAIANVTAKYYEKNGKVELGYFAQDFESLLPSAVSKNEDGLLNLSYREVHTAKIAYLEERIKQLEKKYENN